MSLRSLLNTLQEFTVLWSRRGRKEVKEAG